METISSLEHLPIDISNDTKEPIQRNEEPAVQTPGGNSTGSRKDALSTMVGPQSTISKTIFLTLVAKLRKFNTSQST
ncbi:unnamed protein product [Absidia cylindrospora]